MFLRVDYLMAAAVLTHLSFVQGSQRRPVPRDGTAVATQLVVTATTGDHPVVTFQPSQDAEYSSATATVTTTNSTGAPIIVFPLGWIWAPVGGPPVVPEIPKDAPAPATPTPSPPCTPTPPPACTKTLSYISLSTGGFTSTVTGGCPAIGACPLGTQTTQTTTVSTTVAVALATAFEAGGIPPLATPDQDTVDYYKTYFEQQNITVKEVGEKPTCFNLGWGAPQRDGDGTPSLTSSIQSFCTNMDAKLITTYPGVDTQFQRYGYSYYSCKIRVRISVSQFDANEIGTADWLSANTWNDSPWSCPSTVAIDKDDCIETLTNAMYFCDPNSGTTHGAGANSACVQYNISISMSTNDKSPPWNPQPNPGAQCSPDTQTSDVRDNFFSQLAPVFCASVDKNPKQQLVQDLTDAQLPSSRKRTPPPSRNDYQGYTFSFGWSGSDGGSCSQSCTDAFKNIANTCGNRGGEQNLMSSQGNLDVGCGVYNFNIKGSPSSSTSSKTSASYLSSQNCNNPVAWGKHSDTSSYWQDYWTRWFCNSNVIETGVGAPGQRSGAWSWDTGIGSHGWWKIGWIDGCILDSTSQSQKLSQPLPDPRATCYSLLSENYKNCNNGGIGGYRDAGCLRYSFWAT